LKVASTARQGRGRQGRGGDSRSPLRIPEIFSFEPIDHLIKFDLVVTTSVDVSHRDLDVALAQLREEKRREEKRREEKRREEKRTQHNTTQHNTTQHKTDRAMNASDDEAQPRLVP
jgi:hypothetical protein